MSTSCGCPLCNFSAPTRSLWLSHLRNVHHHDDNFAITCGIDDCTSTYTNCASFVSHVYRQHRDAIISQVNPPCNLKHSNTTSEVDYNALCSYEYVIEERTDLQHTVDQILKKDCEEQQKSVHCSY